MITFKEYLCEGGKATAALGTRRATQKDMKVALKFVSKTLNIPVETLEDRLLGSARLTYAGKAKDSGDVDIAIDASETDMDSAVQKMTKATKNKPYQNGGSTYSFAVPTHGERKIQVDLMFVQSTKWAKFSHFASEHSDHKSGVRNELIHSALKFSAQPGEDVRYRDKEGNDIARASRAYKLDKGVERIFKIAPMRKDGTGRVKSVQHASPEEVRSTLDQEGISAQFKPDADVITDPDKFAQMLFGKGVKGTDMLSTEQLIKLIKKYKPEQAKAIFKDAVKGIKRLKFSVPDELNSIR